MNIQHLSVDEVDYGDKLSENCRRRRVQPEQKSFMLMKKIVCKHSKHGQLVLDPFARTLSTATFCLLLDKNGRFFGRGNDVSSLQKSLQRLVEVYASQLQTRGLIWLRTAHLRSLHVYTWIPGTVEGWGIRWIAARPHLVCRLYRHFKCIWCHTCVLCVATTLCLIVRAPNGLSSGQGLGQEGWRVACWWHVCAVIWINGSWN